LTQIEEKIAAGYPPQGKGSILEKLEMFHKVLVFYLWMSFRNPVSYNCFNEVSDLKTRVEMALDWTLEGVSKLDTPERPRTIWDNAERDRGKHIVYESKLAVKARRATV
jgi:ATP-dependent RNA helicase SUPV3L1/SUV3